MKNVNIMGFTKKSNILEDCLKKGGGVRQFGDLRGELVEKMGGCPMGLSNLCTHLSYLTQFLSPAIFIINRFFKKLYLDLNVGY